MLACKHDSLQTSNAAVQRKKPKCRKRQSRIVMFPICKSPVVSPKKCNPNAMFPYSMP